MKIRILLFLITLLCAAVAGVQSVHADAVTVTVTNTDDSGSGSLRGALAIANNGDRINFSVTGVITLTSGELLVSKGITISGPGGNVLAVDGNAASRVFHIASGNTVVISGLTIRNGSSTDSGGGILNDHATLTVNDSTLSGNSAAWGGGAGILNAGSSGGSATLTVTNSTFSGNSAGLGGGGIVNDGSSGGSATLTVTNSTFSGNSAVSGGGGIVNDGSSGGSATLTVSNSTFSGNSAIAPGGGIVNDGSSGGSATLTIGDTILNAGASGANIFNNSGLVRSQGYNLSSDDASAFLNQPGDQNSTNPMLGLLADNGGPTFTHALLPGSPAIDAGDPNFTPAPFCDQRGSPFARVVNGRIDKGSFEVQSNVVRIR